MHDDEIVGRIADALAWIEERCGEEEPEVLEALDVAWDAVCVLVARLHALRAQTRARRLEELGEERRPPDAGPPRTAAL